MSVTQPSSQEPASQALPPLEPKSLGVGQWMVLTAAFLTYVASAVSAVLTLLYYLSLGRRSN